MDELFAIKAEKSPRLLEWMKEHRIETKEITPLFDGDDFPRWIASHIKHESADNEEMAMRLLP